MPATRVRVSSHIHRVHPLDRKIFFFRSLFVAVVVDCWTLHNEFEINGPRRRDRDLRTLIAYETEFSYRAWYLWQDESFEHSILFFACVPPQTL